MRTALTLSLAVLISSPLFAQDEKKKRKSSSPQIPTRPFTMKGVTFTEEQRTKVEELKNKYGPLLIKNQQILNGVFTEEQRNAKMEAFKAAKESGKNAQEVKAAMESVLNLTDDQKQQRVAIQKKRSELQRKIQSEITALLTREQRASLRRPQQNRRASQSRIAPTYPDVMYGPYDRNVMDVWLADSNKPTPVMFSIHGGGFGSGNKSVGANLLESCLRSGISVVAITYRLTGEIMAPAQFTDSARAVQFVRNHAKAWNIDPTRIASSGGSAGAGISLWLAFHDDLADPKNDDPVLRESSRLTCVSVYNGQTSYDPRVIREMFPDASIYKVKPLVHLFDADLDNLDNLPKKKYKLFEEVSAMPHLTKDDVPAMLSYREEMNSPPDIHHPLFGKNLKEKMDELGIRCDVYNKVEKNSEEWTEKTMDFIKQEFGMK